MVQEETARAQARGEKQNSLEGSEHSLILWRRPIQPLPLIFTLRVREADPVALSPYHLLLYPLLKD